MVFRTAKSITPITAAKITEATKTSIELPCKDL